MSSQITGVQLFRQGATVTRRVTLSAPLPEQIEIPGLPVALLDDHVRLRVAQADGDLAIGSVRVGLHVVPRGDAPPSPDEHALNDLRARLQLARAQHHHLQQETVLLSRIQAPPRPEGEDGKPPPASPMASRLALAEFTDDALADRQQRIRTIEQEIEDLSRQEADLQDRIRRSAEADKIGPDEISKSVTARLFVAGTVHNAELVLEYFLAGPRWAPTYQILIARGGESATLQMRAVVVQRTGEDWSNVEMRLSTAAPLSFSQLPKLTSIRIGKAQPPPPAPGYRPPPTGGASLFADLDRDRKRLAEILPASPPWQAPSKQITPLNLVGLDRFMPAPLDAGADHYGGGGSIGGVRGDWEAGGASMDMDDDMEESYAEMPTASAAFISAEDVPAPAPPRMAKKRKGRSRPSSERLMSKLAASGEKERGITLRTEKPRPTVPQFASLRMAGPDDAQRRGDLIPIGDDERIQHALDRAGARASFNVKDELQSRRSAAQQVSLPDGLWHVGAVDGRFDYAYTAENRLDVPSDGAAHTLPVLRLEAPCEMRYVTVPRVEPAMYRQAAIENPSTAPLLPGPAEVYIDGQYAVTARLPLVAAGGKLQLGLGVEQALRVARNTHFQESRSGESVVAMTELKHRIEIELVNTLPRAAHCEVRERIPQPSKGAEVVVEEETVVPEWAPYTQRALTTRDLLGGRRWIVEIPAGQSMTLTAHYVVKIYANNELVGGNRREV
ncbi:MAG: DUF4139 domain-containing protein [Myxococcota bacterium]